MVIFSNGFLSQELGDLLPYHYQGHSHVGESDCQDRVGVFSSQQISVTLLALQSNRESSFWAHQGSYSVRVWVFGFPLLGSSRTSFRLSFNRICHSKTLGFFGYMSLPHSTPQRHAADIPGIKISHYVFEKLLSRCSFRCRYPAKGVSITI